MRIVVLALVGPLLFISAADTSAQTSDTTCRRDAGGRVNCTTTQRPEINWGALRQPNAADAFEEGRRSRENDDIRRKQNELLDARLERERSTVAAGQTARSLTLRVRGACLSSKEAALSRADLAGFQAVAALCAELGAD